LRFKLKNPKINHCQFFKLVIITVNCCKPNYRNTNRNRQAGRFAIELHLYAMKAKLFRIYVGCSGKNAISNARGE